MSLILICNNSSIFIPFNSTNIFFYNYLSLIYRISSSVGFRLCIWDEEKITIRMCLFQCIIWKINTVFPHYWWSKLYRIPIDIESQCYSLYWFFSFFLKMYFLKSIMMRSSVLNVLISIIIYIRNYSVYVLIKVEDGSFPSGGGTVGVNLASSKADAGRGNGPLPLGGSGLMEEMSALLARRWDFIVVGMSRIKNTLIILSSSLLEQE